MLSLPHVLSPLDVKHENVRLLEKEQEQLKIVPDDVPTANLRKLISRFNAHLVKCNNNFPITFTAVDYYGGDYEKDAWEKLIQQISVVYKVKRLEPHSIEHSDTEDEVIYSIQVFNKDI